LTRKIVTRSLYIDFYFKFNPLVILYWHWQCCALILGNFKLSDATCHVFTHPKLISDAGDPDPEFSLPGDQIRIRIRRATISISLNKNHFSSILAEHLVISNKYIHNDEQNIDFINEFPSIFHWSEPHILKVGSGSDQK
jgi:hypothetical protein